MWELATREGYFSEVNMMGVRILSLPVLLRLGGGAHWRRFLPSSKPKPNGSFLQQVLATQVMTGIRPPVPRSAPPEYALLLRDCWQHDPSCRPTFSAAKKTLDVLRSALLTEALISPLVLDVFRKSKKVC
jgi:hypothetical protein